MTKRNAGVQFIFGIDKLPYQTLSQPIPVLVFLGAVSLGREYCQDFLQAFA
jgi:hypothetical protein